MPRGCSATTRDPARVHAAEDADGGARAGEVGPVATLRGALHASKASGQPDWPTRVSAARALATLRPQELEPTPETQPPTEPTIIVYDLPPGANPVLHRPQPTKTEAPAKGSDPPVDPPAETPPPEPQLFYHRPADGESVEIGEWSPAMPARLPDQPVTLIMHTTDNPQKADLWRAELSAGRLPKSTQDEAQDTGY